MARCQGRVEPRLRARPSCRDRGQRTIERPDRIRWQGLCDERRGQVGQNVGIVRRQRQRPFERLHRLLMPSLQKISDTGAIPRRGRRRAFRGHREYRSRRPGEWIRATVRRGAAARRRRAWRSEHHARVPDRRARERLAKDVGLPRDGALPHEPAWVERQDSRGGCCEEKEHGTPHPITADECRKSMFVHGSGRSLTRDPRVKQRRPRPCRFVSGSLAHTPRRTRRVGFSTARDR